MHAWGHPVLNTSPANVDRHWCRRRVLFRPACTRTYNNAMQMHTGRPAPCIAWTLSSHVARNSWLDWSCTNLFISIDPPPTPSACLWPAGLILFDLLAIYSYLALHACGVVEHACMSKKLSARTAALSNLGSFDLVPFLLECACLYICRTMRHVCSTFSSF